MKPNPNLLFLAIVLLGLPVVALGHGDDEGMTMDMTGTSTTGTVSSGDEADIPSYFRHPEHSGLILTHIILMVVGWVFVLPLAVVFAVIRSRFSVPTQSTFLTINLLGILVATIYNGSTPDLYPNNAHHKLGWLLTWIVCAQALLAAIDVYGRKTSVPSLKEERAAFIPVSTLAMAEHHRLHNMEPVSEYRLSYDSGQGTERNTESLRTNSISSSGELGDQTDARQRIISEDDDDIEVEKPTPSRGGFVDRFVARKLVGLLSSRVLRCLQVYFHSVNRVILIMGFMAITTGAVTYGGIFRAKHIFSGLAHFIKGGVFFWYGVFTLGRWAGCFADLGWAWNVRPSKALVGPRKAAAPTAEFIESFLIFFYGSTNVFLEHLGGWGGAWTAQDLEHVSISIMFLGGGLCGMFVESARIRSLLNASLNHSSNVTLPYGQVVNENESFIPPKSYGFSMNPIPALVVILLGAMMGGHEQSSMISSMVHKQWGNLLAAASIMRGLTYVLMYLSPPTSVMPSRPPSELVTSFCLMAGGLIFMASSSDTIAAMERNRLDAMFVLTVTMGVVTLLMAYIIGVNALKGWVFRRENKSHVSFSSKP